MSSATANALRMWDRQSTASERMCADILSLEGFQNVDPQSPLGGRDGGKDILCDKDGIKFVAACHFSNNDLTFTKNRDKFTNDLEAALKHERQGFIFMTNQQLTPGERKELEILAGKHGQRCLIHNREYLRIVLDSPPGYGFRLRHLDISLTPEEQAAFFANADTSIAAALAEHTRAIDRLSGQITRSSKTQMGFMVESVAVIANAVQADKPVLDLSKMIKASGEAANQSISSATDLKLSANISIDFIRYVHRLLMPTDSYSGYLRQTHVWLVNSTGKSNGDMECPSWDKVPALLEKLVSEWNSRYSAVASKADKLAIPAIADFFHKILAIHPFLDGNGRLARALMSLQARDLIGLQEDLLVDRGSNYYTALRLADAGNLAPLEQLIDEAKMKAKRAV